MKERIPEEESKKISRKSLVSSSYSSYFLLSALNFRDKYCVCPMKLNSSSSLVVGCYDVYLRIYISSLKSRAAHSMRWIEAKSVERFLNVLCPSTISSSLSAYFIIFSSSVRCFTHSYMRRRALLTFRYWHLAHTNLYLNAIDVSSVHHHLRIWREFCENPWIFFFGKFIFRIFKILF